MGDEFDPVGKQCRLKTSKRLADGTIHDSNESLTIKRIADSLGKVMYLISLSNGTTAYVFPDEVEFI